MNAKKPPLDAGTKECDPPTRVSLHVNQKSSFPLCCAFETPKGCVHPAGLGEAGTWGHFSQGGPVGPASFLIATKKGYNGAPSQFLRTGPCNQIHLKQVRITQVNTRGHSCHRLKMRITFLKAEAAGKAASTTSQHFLDTTKTRHQLRGRKEEAKSELGRSPPVPQHLPGGGSPVPGRPDGTCDGTGTC